MQHVITQVSRGHFPAGAELLFDTEIPGLRIAWLHVHREYKVGAAGGEERCSLGGRVRLRERISAGIRRVRIRERTRGWVDCDGIAVGSVVFVAVLHVKNWSLEAESIGSADAFPAFAARIPGDAEPGLEVIPVIVDVALGNS